MTLYGAAVLLAVFGALLLALDALLFVATPWLLARLSLTAPAARTDSILFLRSLPVSIAAAMTVLVFLPGWWRYEPADSGETASVLLLALAALSALPIVVGAVRAFRMFLRTRDRLLLWERRGRSSAAAGGPFSVVEVKSEDLALCVGGFLHPRIYASTEVVTFLEPEELEAALAHEVSHARRRDPLRLLWLGSCPDFLQLFRFDRPWRRAFARSSEFAADAGASHGNPEVALDLASALLKVARLRSFETRAAEGVAEVAVSSAFSSPADLEARVEALANPAPEFALTTPGVRPWMLAVALLALGVSGAMASEQVHTMIEEVGHFLAR
jgi:Zn-dependent protease with chaperone function